MPAQPLTWTEMRARAHAFVADWRGETRERAEAQSFWNDWFNIFGISRRRFVTFEQQARRISTGGAGSLDAFWPAVVAIEHKSAGKDLDQAVGQALDYLGSVAEREMPKISRTIPVSGKEPSSMSWSLAPGRTAETSAHS